MHKHVTPYAPSRSRLGFLMWLDLLRYFTSGLLWRLLTFRNIACIRTLSPDREGVGSVFLCATHVTPYAPSRSRLGFLMWLDLLRYFTSGLLWRLLTFRNIACIRTLSPDREGVGRFFLCHACNFVRSLTVAARFPYVARSPEVLHIWFTLAPTHLPKHRMHKHVTPYAPSRSRLGFLRKFNCIRKQSRDRKGASRTQTK